MDHFIEVIGIIAIVAIIVLVAMVITGSAGFSYQNTITKKGRKFGLYKDDK